MSSPAATDDTRVDSKSQLIEYIASGEKPAKDWRIGTEHEKFLFDARSLRPLPYDGVPGVKALLERLAGPEWQPVYESGNIIALKGSDGGSVTLEPGGQLELSGAPLENIHQTCSEVHRHLRQVVDACEAIGAGTAGLGFNPIWKRDDVPWMPKGRYKIMREYMPKKGNLGIDMMKRTCTVQVNLDYSSEADMIQKMRISLALQPVATALFANSPFKEGKPNGYLSYRSHIWTDTDPDRCGMLPFVFDDSFGYERWVDYILDVPMYFVYRDGVYHDVSGKSFRDYMDGKLEGFEGQLPTMTDWSDHMTTAFPEVRLKKFIEMRGADGGPWGNLCALPALWVGLLYDDQARAEAADLIADWSVEEISAMRDAVPTLALKAPFRDGTVLDIARKVMEICHGGMKRRARLNPTSGLDETMYLKPLDEVVSTGRTIAENLLEAYETRWNGEIDPVYAECRY
ncbi:glutamate--cysteine ligase [Rhodospirillaceae bacterium KN72]|uniref:Glutamate--cysteine ligase n=1 Tax=Pacificispira spongiicola TaxID=2729598 RepID=A0A7Y0HDE6_9PROT|nr:glutamate--cysteine ligase [Pacificispira spongiicola]NMM43731.1 glutamate--cysteine ligase [Pacificispira spongiicola]